MIERNSCVIGVLKRARPSFSIEGRKLKENVPKYDKFKPESSQVCFIEAE
jgi:hypothetical protein